MSSLVSRVLVLALSGTAIGGCYARARVEPEPYSVTEVSSAPVSIETYPHTTYDGRVVYLYDDRWYYRDNDRWVYYRQAPPALERQRPYVQQAPPARRYEPARPVPYGQPYGGRGYQQPYPNYPNGAPQSAPPATRVQ